MGGLSLVFEYRQLIIELSERFSRHMFGARGYDTNKTKERSVSRICRGSAKEFRVYPRRSST